MRSTKQSSWLRRKKRVRSRILGTAKKPRLVVFRSLRYTEAQLIDDEAGKTIVGMNTKSEKSARSVASAQKLGSEIAKKAKEKKVSTCIFDRSGYNYHGRVKAVAEGAREGGLKF